MIPPTAPDDTPAMSAALPAPGGLTDLLGDTAAPRWYRRRSLWAGLAAVLLAGAAGGWWWSKQAAPPAPSCTDRRDRHRGAVGHGPLRGSGAPVGRQGAVEGRTRQCPRRVARALADEGSARAGVADARAALSTDQINLSKSSIVAPADGVVLTRNVDPGNAVAASLQAVTLFTVAEDLTKLRLWVYVDEADVGSVKVGQEAGFTVSGYPGRKFPAQITRVGFGSTITDNVVTYLTYLDVDNADLSLRPGMTATATITATQRKDVLLVPNTALRFTPTSAADPGRGEERHDGRA
jgi:hypothetical protein